MSLSHARKFEPVLNQLKIFSRVKQRFEIEPWYAPREEYGEIWQAIDEAETDEEVNELVEELRLYNNGILSHTLFNHRQWVYDANTYGADLKGLPGWEGDPELARLA